MLGGTKQLEIPRRVVVYYLLFCLFPVVWMTIGTVLIAASVLRAQHEEDSLVLLRAAASAATLELAKGETGRLQPLVERLQRENSLQYVAIASTDGKLKAHTLRDRIGQPFERSDQVDLVWGEFTASRRNNGKVWTREYVAPLYIKKDSVGTLLIGVTEPSIWHACGMMASYTPFTIFGPLGLIVVGAIILNRMVKPLAGIETQLRQSAVASALADVGLHPIKAHTPAALGWNRLVAEFQSDNKGVDLDRRLTEAVQSRRADRADDILNSLSDGIAVTDPQGNITTANQAFAAMFDSQRTAESLRGKPLTEIVGIHDDEDGSPNRLSDPELRSRVVTDEIIRGEHDRQILRIVRSPIRSTDRAMKQGLVWAVRDVTQQKLADKMRDQFLSTATHELRTPLANIRAYAETLSLDDVIDVENQKEFLNVIITESTRLARFIDDLLSIDSMEAGALALDRKECDLLRMFEDVVGKVKGQMEQKDIQFAAVYPAKWPKLRLDKDKFMVALVNLLGNAAKYTPLGGRVTLKVKVTDSALQIDVVDTGIGISEDELPRVFDKFFRSQSAAVQSINGTGIGLSMAQEVIELHDGELTVQSELGKGTTFTATLPLNN
jgi:PAS domain S-box-containing protein